LFGAGVEPRRVDLEKGSIGRLEPGHGPDEAAIGGEDQASSIPTSTGCACRGGADAPFEPKAV